MQVLPKPCKNLINTELSKNMLLNTIKISLLRVIHSIYCSKAKAANDKAEVSQNDNIFTSEACLPWTNQWWKEDHRYLIDPTFNYK